LLKIWKDTDLARQGKRTAKFVLQLA